MVTEALYYLRSVPGSKLLSEYKLWGIAWRGNRSSFLIKLEDKVYLLTLTKIKPEPFSLLPWGRKGSQIFTSIFQKLQVSLNSRYNFIFVFLLQQTNWNFRPFFIDFWILFFFLPKNCTRKRTFPSSSDFLIFQDCYVPQYVFF